MTPISDEEMARRLETVRPYAVVLLKKGPAYVPPETRPPEQASIVMEHGRRNMQLGDAGKLAIVGPLKGAGDVVGLCIFNVEADEVRSIMDADGAVQAGIFVYEIVTLFGKPGQSLA
jgi:hypothetical protein